MSPIAYRLRKSLAPFTHGVRSVTSNSKRTRPPSQRAVAVNGSAAAAASSSSGAKSQVGERSAPERSFAAKPCAVATSAGLTSIAPPGRAFADSRPVTFATMNAVLPKSTWSEPSSARVIEPPKSSEPCPGGVRSRRVPTRNSAGHSTRIGSGSKSRPT